MALESDACLTVTVVSRHRLFRESLACALDGESLVAETRDDHSLEAAVGTAADAESSILVVDLGEADSADLATIGRLKMRRPEVRMIGVGLSGVGDVLQWQGARLEGYLLTSSSLAQLTQAIEDASQGKKYCSPELAGEVFARLSAAARRTSPPLEEEHDGADLTPREQETVRLIREGLTNKEIADRLGISVYTVKNHVHRILEKLQVRDRWAAVVRIYGA